MERLVLAKSNPLSANRRSDNQWAAVNQRKGQLADYRKRLADLCERLYGGIPKQALIGEEPILPPKPAAKGVGEGNEQAGQNPVPPAPEPPASPPSPPPTAPVAPAPSPPAPVGHTTNPPRSNALELLRQRRQHREA
jgi:hypothetical protein